MIQTPGPQGQTQMNVNFSQTTPIKCEKCGNPTFKQTMMLRRVSALISPNGQEAIIPVAVFACEKCNHVNEEFENMDVE